MKKKFAAIAAFLGATGAALAEGTTSVPQAVTDQVTALETAATDYAAVIFPYVKNVGLAFVGITVMYLLFRLWRRFASGR